MRELGERGVAWGRDLAKFAIPATQKEMGATVIVTFKRTCFAFLHQVDSPCAQVAGIIIYVLLLDISCNPEFGRNL